MFTRFQWSELCHNSLVKVFQGDTTGAVSLEVVRLLNRMIKESKYRVNPNVLSCLLHLRLKTEIGVRASKTSAEKEPVNFKRDEKRGKGTAATQTHLSKKAKKVLKEKEVIRRDMKEAEGEVDKEERNKTVWEHILKTFRGLNRSLSSTRRR
jgi:nucleolar complex protein 3